MEPAAALGSKSPLQNSNNPAPNFLGGTTRAWFNGDAEEDMISSSTAGNPVGNVSSWYQSQLEREKEVDRRYEAEIAQFSDSFESIAKLDGTAYDQDDKPGEVRYRGTGSVLSKSLQRTDDGFKVLVATISAGPTGVGIRQGLLQGSPDTRSKPVTTRTEYDVNENTGSIAVLRRQTSLSQPTLTETFVLDTNAGVSANYRVRGGDGHVEPPRHIPGPEPSSSSWGGGPVGWSSSSRSNFF